MNIKKIKIFFVFSFIIQSVLMAQTKFSVHGHLTQAYAISEKHVIYGIPNEGTFDYRNLAIQFRYEIYDKSIFAVQLNHRRLGISPLMTTQEDVTLDWAFFEYRFSDFVSAKAGKVLIPFGIYNEIRDVGVLLPFYRAPYSPYGESNFISKYVNGALISFSFSQLLPWEINFDLYSGQYQLTEWLNNVFVTGGFPVQSSNHSEIIGYQLWLNTPVDGLRLGNAMIHGRGEGGIFFDKDFGLLGERTYNAMHLSIDCKFKPVYFCTEFTKIYMSKDNGSLEFAYAQMGINLTEDFSINSQAEISSIKGIKIPNSLSPFARGNTYLNKDFLKDYAAGLLYRYSSYLTFRLETHWINAILIEDAVPTDPFIPNGYEFKYSIISISTSF